MLRNITEPLLAWYDANHRVLPWRQDHNPYHIWVSEIMLQQTRVEAVRPYFQRFMEALPDVQALADCPEDQLLKLWEGLGYYNRVRNLQKAARILVQEYNGALPETPQELQKLPGIGQYTAGAISSIAYDQAVPAVDGNVLRIWARLTADDTDVMKEAARKKAYAMLAEIMPKRRSGDMNQAFMDLGSRICLPKGEVNCHACPLADFCQAHLQNRVAEFPVRKAKTSRRMEDLTVMVVRDGDKVALHKRPAKGLLAGLYELPSLSAFRNKEDVLNCIRERGLEPLYIEELPPAKHVFSHVEWHMQGYLIRVAELSGEGTSDWILVDHQEAQKEYPVPSAFAAYASYMNMVIGKERISLE